ncbi:MAG TPA: hypothetical protein VF138_06090 [Caulobacteraceae bacterium]
MLKALLKAAVARFEKRYDYDVSYMRALIEADPGAFFAFAGVQRLGGYAKAPKDALIAARLVGTLAEDCGPCTQIVVQMGEEQGVAPTVLKAVLTGDEAAMGADAGLAWKFARASLARDMETADPLRDEIVRRWGEKGLAAIALAIASARVFPTVKYALGHGKTCSKVQVKGEAVAPKAA